MASSQHGRHEFAEATSDVLVNSLQNHHRNTIKGLKGLPWDDATALFKGSQPVRHNLHQQWSLAIMTKKYANCGDDIKHPLSKICLPPQNSSAQTRLQTYSVINLVLDCTASHGLLISCETLATALEALGRGE